MVQKLLDREELQQAIRYEIISPSFAERVSQLIDAYGYVSRPTRDAADVAETCDIYGCSKPAAVRLCVSHYKPSKSCSICGQADHVSSDCGLVLPNPPRR